MRQGYRLKQPSRGQQIPGEYGRHPWPPLHGLVHAIVAGPVVPAPQYSCSVLQSAPGPQLGQLLQSQVSTQAPRGMQCASGTHA